MGDCGSGITQKLRREIPSLDEKVFLFYFFTMTYFLNVIDQHILMVHYWWDTECIIRSG